MYLDAEMITKNSVPMAIAKERKKADRKIIAFGLSTYAAIRQSCKYVIAHTKDAKFVAGMCNFYDDKSCSMDEWQKYIWYILFSIYMILCIVLYVIVNVYEIIGKLGKLIKDKYIFPVFDYLEKKCDLWD